MTTETTDSEVALLRRQLERERRARRAAEEIGEAATTELWGTVRRLEDAEAELRERVELADLCYALSRSLRADLDPALMLDRAARELGTALDVDRVVVRLAEGVSVGRMVTQWCRPGVEALSPSRNLDADFSRLVTEHVERREAVWLADTTVARSLPFEDLPCRAYAGVPLLAGRQVVGWLAIHTAHEPREWSLRDQTVAESLAHDLSGALLQAQAHQRQVDTVRELQAVDEVKNEFVSRVSHELRTPLTSIRGYTELLSDGEVGDPSPAQRRTLDVILRNCQRLLLLTENLLSLSRIDAHEFQPVRDPVDLPALLVRVGDRATAMVAGRALDLTLPAAPPPDVQLWGDEAELERVLVNLLGNAVKFTPDGGRVRLGVEVRQGSMLLDVVDSGCGIDAGDHARVFERFYRTHQAQASEVPGAGLGLALVDTIVRAHGGRVEVESTPGEGTRFRVVLPLASG